MTVILGIIVIFVLAICFRPKEDTTSETNNNPIANQYPYDMAWPEPKPDNLWDSFDYFVRIGEVFARHMHSFDEEIIYLHLYVCDAGNGKQRGHFELRTAEFDTVKNVFRNIPYLESINLPFIGFEPNSSMLSMEQSEIRRLIMNEAPHVNRISCDSYNDLLAISITFRGIQ